MSTSKNTSFTVMNNELRKSLCEKKIQCPSMTQNELVEWLKKEHGIKVSQGAISNTLKRSNEYLNDNKIRMNSKRVKSVKYPEVDNTLFEWFLTQQESVNLSGEILQEKAAEILKILYPQNTPNIKFSQGWLESFKNRHGIKSFRRFGESGSANVIAIEEALPELRSKLDNYVWKDIYNMDETGLFFRMQADHSLATKQLEGKKQSKERITVAVCANGDGTDKVPLWIIGKYENPRCFRNINRTNMGCTYKANKKAWMTGSIYLGWLNWFDRRMEGRKVLLILDNCPGHLKQTGELRNTEVIFLPPNTTSKIQPCDAGIIRALKGHYRRRFNREILTRIELGE